MSSLNTSLSHSAREGMAERVVVHHTRGHRRGPITRLMSPSDLGELLRPFVFLDHVDTVGGSTGGLGLHPHSGIATVTWIMEGNVAFEDTTGKTGKIPTGGLEWMQAGRGVWHGGGLPTLAGAPSRARAGTGAKHLSDAGSDPA